MVNSYIVVDFHSKKILSARDINKRMPVASLTKIATSIVVLDWAQAVNADLSANLIVPQSAALIGGPNQLGLIPGDLMSIRDALYSAVLGSKVTGPRCFDLSSPLIWTGERSGSGRMSFVILLFTFCNCYFNFCFAFFKIHFSWNNCKSISLHFSY